MTREEAIKSIQDFMGWFKKDKPIYEALELAIKALSAEPCEDAISRKAVSDAMYELCGEGSLKDNPWRDNPHIDSIIDAIEHLPSVTPKQKVGHWILDHVVCDVIYEYHCSACGHHLELGGRTIKQDQAEGYSLFCNGCGAKMAESEDRDDIRILCISRNRM